MGRVAGGNIDALTGAQALSIIGYPSGYIYGLAVSNNVTDATNDLDIAAGACRASPSSSVVANIDLSSALTKRLDAAWAVGSGNGGLDTGSIADTTYHVFLIRRSDTGVVDALFSASATSPTMPANYDSFRRIYSFRRISGAIWVIKQDGDQTMLSVPISNYNSGGAKASALPTLSVPEGIEVEPILQLVHTQGTAGFSGVYFGGAAAGSANVIYLATSLASDIAGAGVLIRGKTNTSRQVYHMVFVSGGTVTGSTVNTVGWIDRRGQDGGA